MTGGVLKLRYPNPPKLGHVSIETPDFWGTLILGNHQISDFHGFSIAIFNTGGARWNKLGIMGAQAQVGWARSIYDCGWICEVAP